MTISKLSANGRATIPREVRSFLNLKAGDRIKYDFVAGQVVIRKVQALDANFLGLASESFSDWNSPEADAAFRDV